MQGSPVVTLSPSFSGDSDPKLAGIAARVVRELASDHRRANAVGISSDRDPESDQNAGAFDFDFTFVTRNSESSPLITADEIFEDGKIRPVYPVKSLNSDPERPRTRRPLGKLFIEERETATASSASSSEADESDAALPEERLWKKSASSAGRNSKRWNLKSLMNRSQSDGSKDSVLVLARCASSGKKEDGEKKPRESPPVGGKVRLPPSSNRDGVERLRSFLPYRLDLVGLFGNVNGMKKNQSNIDRYFLFRREGK